MKTGIVGLPNVGKSTLFKALTKQQVDISNYPFCTINPNIGIVPVPDERLEKLAAFCQVKEVIPAVIEFIDIAGLVKGAAEGEGLGNKFLSHIREVDVIAEVVRVFENDKIIHVHKKIDPENDINVVETELILADLETINKRIGVLEHDLKSHDKEAGGGMAVIKKIKNILVSGKPARETGLSEEEFNLVKDLCLLTFKPVLYVYNIAGSQKIPEKLEKRDHVAVDMKTEEDVMDMSEEERKELGFESGLGKLIKEAYKLLGLITFFTVTENKPRAWPIKKGFKAPETGGIIHTDFREKFIKAQVIHYDKLMEAGSWQKARENGWLRTEGKNYIVCDGDIIEFKI